MELSSNHCPFYTQVQKEISRIKKKSHLFRIYYYLFRGALIILAAFIAVISGFQGRHLEPYDVFNTLLILGVIATSITSFDTLFQVETKKNIYKLMLVGLKEIRDEIVFYHGNKDENEIDARIRDYLFPKYQSIVAQSKTLIEKE